MESIRSLKRDHAIVAAACLLLPACGGEAPDPGRSPESEDVAAVEQALHEATCWTNTTPHYTFFSHGQVRRYLAISQNGNYTRPNCPNQWVVDVEQVLGRRLQLWGGPEGLLGDPPLDWCPGFWAFGKAKGWKNGAWHDIHTWTVKGLSLCFPPGCFCANWPVTGNGHIVESTHGYSKVRVVVQAGFALTYQGAYAGLDIL